MNKVIEKGAPVREVPGPYGRLVKTDARRNIIAFFLSPDNTIHPVPFRCNQCSEIAMYSEDKWYCTQHWQEYFKGKHGI